MPRAGQFRPVIDRWESKTDRSGGPDACWPWTGALSSSGYGLIYMGTRPNGTGMARGAHRVGYELLVGPIADGIELDHLCRNRRCVNPAHLEPVTGWMNNLRGTSVAARNVLKTHCPKGHPYDDANTIHETAKGGPARRCRTCRNAIGAQSYKRRMARLSESERRERWRNAKQRAH